MQARVILRRASVGSTRRASGTVSTRTSPALYILVARMLRNLPRLERFIFADLPFRRQIMAGAALMSAVHSKDWSEPDGPVIAPSAALFAAGRRPFDRDHVV